MNNTEFEQKKKDYKKSFELVLEATLLLSKYTSENSKEEIQQMISETNEIIDHIEKCTSDEELSELNLA